jgi:hypothetical protein
MERSETWGDLSAFHEIYNQVKSNGDIAFFMWARGVNRKRFWPRFSLCMASCLEFFALNLMVSDAATNKAESLVTSVSRAVYLGYDRMTQLYNRNK